MQRDGVALDQKHEFTGVTVTVISVENIKSHLPIDGNQIYVQVRIRDNWQKTSNKINDRDKIVWNQSFFYNTTEILDDDVQFELFSGQGGRNLSDSSARISGPNSGKLIGTTNEDYQFSRYQKGKQQKKITLYQSKSDRKEAATLLVQVDYRERQDIVGGIKCPNLSLRPSKIMTSKITLQNKYANYKNLYSWMDGGNSNCEFFPKKFLH